MLSCSKQPAKIPFSICEVLPSPPFPPLFLTQQQSTLLDKEEISSSERGETAREPRNENTERGSPEGLEKFYHCPGISNLEVEGVTPEKVKRVFLLVPSTQQATLAGAFPCQYNCVHTGHLPALQGSCGEGKEYQHSRASKHSYGRLVTEGSYLHCTTAETRTTFVCSLMLKGIKHIRAQSHICPINPVPKMPHNYYKRPSAFLQERRGHCKEGKRIRRTQ